MRRNPLILLTACVLSTSAHAELVRTLYTGTSHSARSDLRVRQSSSDGDATFRDVGWEPRPFEDAPYYGVSLAWYPRVQDRWNTSFDFTHYQMYLKTQDTVLVQGRWNGESVDEHAPVDARISSLEISHGVNLTALNLGWRWAAAAQDGFLSHVAPEVGVGLIGYLPHAEGSINGVPSEGDYQMAGTGFQVFAGAEYRISPRIGVLARLKFDDGRLDLSLSPQSRIETRTRTFHGIAGVSVHWGDHP